MCRDPLLLLLVEDNPADADLVRMALQRFSVPYELEVASDGEVALAVALGRGQSGQIPDLILLDLNVPKADGFSLLAAIKGCEKTRHIPVAVFTSSSAPHDILQAYRSHANCFIIKPATLTGLVELFAAIEALVILCRARAGKALDHPARAPGSLSVREAPTMHGPNADALRILLVEDNAGDVDLVKMAAEQFSVPHVLEVAGDGELALERVLGSTANGRLPDLVILDLNIPKIDGRSVLAAIKENEATRHIPVLVFTSSAAERDVLAAYRAHANACITKPANIKAFLEAFSVIERFWLQAVRLPPHPESGSTA
jgi:CheY-like chemotaxis protein